MSIAAIWLAGTLAISALGAGEEDGAPCILEMVPPPGAHLVGGDGLREVRVTLAGPIDPDPVVRVRTDRLGWIDHFTTRFEHGVLTISFSPSLHADRFSIFIDDIAVTPVARYTALAGDADRNGVVEPADLERVAAAAGSCTPEGDFDPLADLDGDGCVDLADAALVIENLGMTLPRPSGGRIARPQPGARRPRQGRGGPSPGAGAHASAPAEARAVFDEGQSGALPPVSVTRDYATVDALGAPVGSDEPRWGRAQMRAPLQEWALARATANHIAWVAAGADRNGNDPMICYYLSAPRRLEFWIDAPIDDGDPTFTINVTRETIRDLLVGTDIEQEFRAYDPQAGLVLPGCFLYLCKRWRDLNQDPLNRNWTIEAISVVAFQRDAGGDWAFQIVGDGPPLAGDDTALGLDRAQPWAMSAYYPVVAGQHPLLRAFVPVTDYTSDSGQKKGGQAFLFDATRPGTATPWTFGEFFMIDEHVEEGTHFHTAAWTPRGVVVAMGDAADRNENILYTCGDWDDYANAFLWSKHDRAFGAGTHPDEPSRTVASQFAGAVPGRDPNTFLVGPDIQGGGVFECSVPENPDDGLAFTRVWGEHFASDDADGLISMWLHKPAPEHSSRVVTRTFPHGPAWNDQKSAARVLYSADSEHFVNVARLPTTVHHAAYVALHGGDILLFNRNGQGNQSPSGIWSMPAPPVRGPYRGLSVAPGATNLLAVSGGGLAGVSAGSTTALTQITDGLHPVTGEPLDAPGLGPLYHVQADASSTLYLGFDPTGGVPMSPGFAYLTLWYRVIGPQGVPARVSMTDAGGQVQSQVTWQLSITNREQWVPHTVLLDAGAFGGDFVPHVRLLSDGSVPRAADFVVQVDGFYANERPPYATAPGTTSPNEQVTQPLGALDHTWTVGAEMHVPYFAEDWLSQPGINLEGERLVLATLVAGEGDYAEVYLDLSFLLARLGVEIHSGGELAGSMLMGNFYMQRFDRMWIALSQASASQLTLYGWSGGSTETGLQSVTVPWGLATPPTEIRFASHDFSQVPAVDVLMVAVDSTQARGRAGVIDLLSSDGGAIDPPRQAEP